jgi:hypothetical protein
MLAMLDCDSAVRLGFLVHYTNTDSIGFWYQAPKHCLTIQAKVFGMLGSPRTLRPRPQGGSSWRPRPLGGSAEADADADAEAARRFAVDSEAEATRIAAEAKAARRFAANSASAHHPVVQSPECKHAEREWYKFCCV